MYNTTTSANEGTVDCQADKVIEEANKYLEYTAAGFAGVAIGSIPMYAAVMDRIGRRPVLVVTLLGMAADRVACALIPSLELLVGVHSAFGIFGNSYVVLGALFSSAADLSRGRGVARAHMFGYLEGSAFIGVAAGPYLAGVMVDALGYQATFLISAGVLASMSLFAFITIPETLSPMQRRQAGPLKLCTLLPSHALWELFHTRNRAIISCTAFLYWFSARIVKFALNPFAKERFDWGAYNIGILYTLVSVCAFVSNVIILRLLAGRLDKRSIIIIGFAFLVLGCTEMGLALDHSSLLVLGMAVLGLCGFLSPSFRDLWSWQSDEQHYGAILGAAAAMENFSAAIAPLLAAPLYDVFSNLYNSPNAVFYVGGGVALSATIFIPFLPISALHDPQRNGAAPLLSPAINDRDHGENDGLLIAGSAEAIN